MRVLREPLLHFVLAGGLLFAAYSWLNRAGTTTAGAEHTVRITEREVAWLTESWRRQWQRPPNESELHGMLADYLREELLAREARELELDRDDTVVRRRLAQKMTFFLEDTAHLAEPTEAELRARYEAQRARFVTPAQSSFVQVFFSAEKRGARAAGEATRVLGELANPSTAGAARDPSALGDASLLPAGLADADRQAIAGQFGDGFADAVAALAPGSWQGPIASSFGFHLVRVTGRQEARSRSFEEVRAELVRDLRREREEEVREAYFAGLLKKYDVQVAESLRPLLGPALEALRDASKR